VYLIVCAVAVLTGLCNLHSFAVCKYGGGRQSMEVVKAWPGNRAGNGGGVRQLLGVRTSLALAFPLQGASSGPEPAE